MSFLLTGRSQTLCVFLSTEPYTHILAIPRWALSILLIPLWNNCRTTKLDGALVTSQGSYEWKPPARSKPLQGTSLVSRWKHLPSASGCHHYTPLFLWSWVVQTQPPGMLFDSIPCSSSATRVMSWFCSCKSSEKMMEQSCQDSAVNQTHMQLFCRE